MFTGFTDETVDFMWGIRFNNERAWFEAHKEIYLTHFYQPMRELGDELYDYIAAKRPDLGLIRKVTRIYRDVRRLHGRGPYMRACGSLSSSPRRSGRPTPPSGSS